MRRRLLFVLTGLAAIAPGAASAAVDLAKQPGALESVPMQYRPIWRWWWPAANVDPAELDAELVAMKAAGFGGVEQVLLRHPNDWWTPAFRANTKHAIEKATALGMRFDTTLGPMWPISSKAVDDVSKGLSMQEAVWSSMDLVGPSVYAGPVPQVNDNGARQSKLVAVTAAQVLQDGASSPGAGGTATPTILDPKTAIDLTPKVANGVLTWQVPAGRWKVVATWMRETGQRVHGDAVTLAGAVANNNLPMTVPDLGGELGPLVPDHFSRAATDATLGDFDATLFGGDVAAVLRRNGGHVFEDSLELNHVTASSPLPDEQDGCIACNGRFWTPAFLDEFRKRRGYDLTPLLPVIFGSFDLPNGGGLRVKHDYFETLADLLVANHFEPIRAWANAHGLTQRSQGYKLQGSDKTHVSSKLQLPDSESLDDGDTGTDVAPGSAAANAVIDDYRQVVSGAHLSGASQMTLEAGANLAGEYDMSVDDYKVIADRAFAAGMTTMALHGFAYRTYQDPYQSWSWPGWSAFSFLFAESWNQAHPAFSHWSGLAGYYGRISAAMRNGKPQVELTVLSTPSSSHLYGSKGLASALRASDYTWDRIDDESLGELPVPKGGRILPSGPAYRAVLVDSLAAISQTSAERLLALAKGGVPVVIKGDLPKGGLSYRDASAEDAAIKTAFAALLALPNVRQVKTGKDAVAALVDLRVATDLRHGDLPIVAQHRRTAAGDVWFLYNNSTKPASGDLTFSASGRASRIDPWTGSATPLGAQRIGKGATTLALALAPGETTLIAFNRAAPALMAANGASPAVADPITVTGPWALTVKTTGPDGDGDVALRLDKLTDWQTIPQLAGASGTGTYVAKVSVPADWLAKGAGVRLDLGAIGGFLALSINGKPAPVPSITESPRDVTKFLKPGENELRATVATTVTNVIVAHAQSGDARYADFAKNTKQPYGLIGPVRLIAFAKAKLAPISPKRLVVRFYGRRHRHGGVLVTVAALGQKLNGITVELRRGTTLVARSRIPKADAKPRRVVLRRPGGRKFPAGAYTLIVRSAHKLLVGRTVHLRKTGP